MFDEQLCPFQRLKQTLFCPGFRCADEIMFHTFETGQVDAARLVMTESAFFASAAQKECFNDLNVERYEVVGTFDSRMCDYCGEMNGKVFPMKDFKEGTTAPPFHPWCRCTTAPYFEDMKDVGERWMRDPETEKGDYAPQNMTFDEWKSVYIKKESTMDEWEAAHYGRDVTEEYRRKSNPGSGKITIGNDYDNKRHRDEIEFAQWLHKSIGGDIQLLSEPKENGIKTPDYLWRGKLWDLKCTTTEKSANSAVRKGIQQISSNPGGVILDFKNNDFSFETLKRAIDERMKWYEHQNADIIVVSKGKLFCVLRYRK